ncbi:ankyrin repeat domain-containing protein [Wolbachia endosymbiont of Atemnus politus]|uniref:ankyrin repeat domain-containing protein n=2 Tax=Wolbachia endosymbiont of Atemnus politus TaxID=2682840 RepID=UPI001573444F|nr:ankyrin repeat domain-containing protein [Wolbachia endosymbiont of Atemnus politus]
MIDCGKVDIISYHIVVGLVMAYSDDDVRKLYLNIDGIIKKKPQVSFEELSKELNTEIDLEQEPRNVLGDLLLARAIEDSNLDFVKFLFENKLRIISIVSHEKESYHIIKARNGSSILNHAINSGNTEILDLLLQSMNTEQQELESESKLYKLRKKLEDNEIYDFYHKIDQDFLSKNGCSTTFPQQKQMGYTQSKLCELCQILKDHALFTAVGKGNTKAVELLIASGANPEAQEAGGEKRTVLEMAIEEGNEKIVAFLISTISKKQEKQKAPHIETNSTSNSGNRSVGNKPAATEPPVSLNNNDLLNHNRSSRPTATVSPISTNSDNRNHDNEIPVVTEEINNGQAAMPSNEKETKYKESKENFHTSLRNDVIGVVITGLFIAAAVMVPPVASAVACGILAALVAIATGLHAKNSTLPSYREMRENRVTEFQRHALPSDGLKRS